MRRLNGLQNNAEKNLQNPRQRDDNHQRNQQRANVAQIFVQHAELIRCVVGAPPSTFFGGEPKKKSKNFLRGAGKGAASARAAEKASED